MNIFFTFLRLFVRIDTRLVTMAGLLQLLVDHQQGLQRILVPPIWLDNQQVMQLLKISATTLKRRRLEGTLPFTRMRGKCYYKDSDIQEILMKEWGRDKKMKG